MSKPVILSVDDDPDVLRAIESDLRRRYRQDYRIVKATSGPEALDAALRLKQRGTAIALFLVDARMPDMSGPEMLIKAKELHPESRKVLLTGYADTEAAITSINEIGLDHYLLKPWNPPEDRLYPVLDDVLEDWRATTRLPYAGIRVAGTRWSPQSYAVKEFLSRNGVPYQWIDLDADPSMRTLVEETAGSTARLPVVFFEDGTSLVEPNQRELAERAGMRTRAAREFYDLVIVGGGPAGLASAVYGASEGLSTLLVEQQAPGGQAGTSSQIENYLGFPTGITGADLAKRATDQARRFGAEILSAQEVTGIRREDPYRVLTMADGSEVSAYGVVFAAGVAVRRLEAPGLDALTGAGVYYGAAMTEAASYRGADVCVVGGANSAGQGALFFSRYAHKVTMLVRSPLKKGMSQYLIDRIEPTENIEVVEGVEVSSVRGDEGLQCVLVRDRATGEQREVECSAVFIFIGAAPRTDLVAGLLELDEQGFVLTGPDLPRSARGIKGWTLDRDPYLLETNVPGIFAVGDVRAGSGKRVAAAVGEGSGVVGMVHRYLETV